ncbi:DoxX family protein [Chitinophaga vietnamensis]|uniref:DoxX family protein n=1 Tax=Chitinophaga vietnamensis TaxID=2593957 RepID=UPI001F42740F|nr:DoxX family protein [Chitinophaga vietnamensis]
MKATIIKRVVYWIATALVAWEMALGAEWDLVYIPFVRDVMAHLHYPRYFAVIMGIWKIPAAIALLIPKFGRVKEWAYAGAIFLYTGAAISHLSMGDTQPAIGPLVFAALTVISWATRPESRRFLPAGVSLKVATSKGRNASYWTATLIIEFVLLSGGLADIFHAAGAVDGMAHLGYPLYFTTLLGCWKISGAIALLLPRFPRLQEWAYIGIFLDFTGAVASHAFMGDNLAHLLWPLFFSLITILSWGLRPSMAAQRAQILANGQLLITA